MPNTATTRAFSPAASRSLPMLNLRLVEPAVLIDISRIAELDAIRDRGDVDRDRRRGDAEHADGLAGLAQKLPLLAAALPFVGHFQTRNRGTVCGSIAHADPSSELPLALAVLGGAVVLRSQQRGERVLAAEAFQQDMLTTAREPDELIAAVRFPVSRQGRRVPRSGAPARRFRHHRGRGDRRRARRGDARRRRHGRPADGARDRRRRRRVRSPPGRDELEGYEDMHASAAMRRDLFRKSAPRVVEEATDAPREQERSARVALTLNGRKLCGRGRAAHAADRFSAPRRSARPAPMSAASTASAAPAPC